MSDERSRRSAPCLRIKAPALVGLAIGAVLLAGCGGSSKPSYCSQVSNLEKSLQDLGNINIIQNGTSALTSAAQKIESSAKALVSAAKSDFPSETSALSSSVDALVKSAQQLSSSPSAGAAAALPGEIAAGASAVKSFAGATSAKCG